MAETGNIEELAKIISKDIFKLFKWNIRTSQDINWPCVTDIHDKKTHPTDVVFYYSDPYLGKTIYLNTDLKSYQEGTVNSNKIRSSLQSLSKSVECANISTDWQDIYILDDASPIEIIGLLFIFNHDNEYDKDFTSKILNPVSLNSLHISEENRLCVFGPADIRTLNKITIDIKSQIADKMLPDVTEFGYYYPDQTLSKRHGSEWGQPATIETLMSPWIIIKHKKAGNVDDGYLIYYKKDGDTVDEFIYFIDTLSHYQLLLGDAPIRIKLVDPVLTAKNNFDKAKHAYLNTWGADEAREQRIFSLTVESLTQVIPSFNPLEIGMRDD